MPVLEAWLQSTSFRESKPCLIYCPIHAFTPSHITQSLYAPILPYISLCPPLHAPSATSPLHQHDHHDHHDHPRTSRRHQTAEEDFNLTHYHPILSYPILTKRNIKMAMTDNLYEHGGRQPPSHILPAPLWVGILRVIQAFLALITLALSAYALSIFGGYGGFGLNIFTSLLTFGFLIYIAITGFTIHASYNMWAQLGLEIALVIFWLSTFGAIASLAAAFGIYDHYNGYVYGYGDASAAVSCTKAAAALTAFAWVAFVATLVHTCKSPTCPISPCPRDPRKTRERNSTNNNVAVSIHRQRKVGGLGGPVTQEHKLEPVAGGQEYAQQPYQQAPVAGQQYPQQAQQPYQQSPYPQQSV